MKKVRFLIAVLVCAVMMMGVGYAWWNDSFTLAGTAKTGNMNVELKNWKLESKTPNLGGIADPATGSVCVSNTNKKFTITLCNLYPGAVFKLTGDIKNNGTIPAKYTGISNISWGGSTLLKNQLQAAWGGSSAPADTEYKSIEEFLATVNGVNTVGKVVPAAGIATNIYFRVNPTAGNDVKCKTVTASFILNFKQFNAQ